MGPRLFAALLAVGLGIACAPAANGRADAADAADSGAPVADAGEAPVDAGAAPDAGTDTTDAGPPGPDPRCSGSNCEAMIASCGVQLFAEPTGTCVTRGVQVPPDYDAIYAERYCSPVCLEFGDGEMLRCFAQNAGTCLQGSPGRAQVRELCVVPSETVAESVCRSGCLQTRTSCESACPTTSFEDCMDCELVCGIAAQHCLLDCPQVPRP